MHEWHKQCYYEDCYPELGARPEEAEKVIMKWAAEHPIKTKLKKFKELFPDAPLRPDGTPQLCPTALGWGDTCNDTDCADCRNRPYVDQKGADEK